MQVAQGAQHAGQTRCSHYDDVKYIDDILKLATSAMTEKPLSPFHISSTILFSVVKCTYNASFYCAA